MHAGNSREPPFIRPDASEAHLTQVSRLCSILVLVVGGGSAWVMRDVSVDQAWRFLASLGTGTGAVFMLRWRIQKSARSRTEVLDFVAGWTPCEVCEN